MEAGNNPERPMDEVNPDWVRLPDWPYVEDWDSPRWKRAMAFNNKRLMIMRNKYGFISCPRCKQGHTALTLTCRECSYSPPLTEEDWRRETPERPEDCKLHKLRP